MPVQDLVLPDIDINNDDNNINMDDNFSDHNNDDDYNLQGSLDNDMEADRANTPEHFLLDSSTTELFTPHHMPMQVLVPETPEDELMTTQQQEDLGKHNLFFILPCLFVFMSI